MTHCVLPNRCIIAVTGDDAEHLLHNVLTCDVEGLPEGVARPGALLTPQGKVMFDFLVSRASDGFAIDIRADAAGDFLKRMMLYKLRAKAEFAQQDESLVAVCWDDDSGASDFDSTLSVSDERFAEAAVRRHVLPAGSDFPDVVPLDAWHRMRIAHGVAESGTDFELGDVFGHDISFDQNGGIDFKKGCFVGQEVVSRMQHRGTARRRVVIVTGEGDLPATGTVIEADGRSAGALGTVAGNTALAIARLDRLKDAMDAGKSVMAGDVPVTVSLPPGVQYTWPEPDHA